MSWSKPRTTFNADELERLSSAPNRIFGLYEKLGTYQPSLSSRLSDAAMQLAPHQNSKHSTVSEPQFDSGLGDELPVDDLENGPPKPPVLITDSENHDSGYGPESMDTDDDDVERDSVIKVAPPKPVTVANTKRNNLSKGVRRPKVNHLPKTAAPIAATSSKVTTTTTSSKTVHTYTHSQTQSSTAAHRPNVIAAKVAKDLQKVKDTSRSWETTLDIIELHRNIQYFLPNKDGDT